MSTLLTYMLIILVTYRITRLIIEDRVPPLGPLRDKIMLWWDPTGDPRAQEGMVAHWGYLGKSLRYLFGCPWCMSVWVGAGVVYVFTLYVSVPLPYAAWIVAAAGAGLAATLED